MTIFIFILGITFHFCGINNLFHNVRSNNASNISDDGIIYKQFKELNYNCHIEKSIFLSPIDPIEISCMIMKFKDYSSYYEGLLTNTIIKKHQLIYLYSCPLFSIMISNW